MKSLNNILSVPADQQAIFEWIHLLESRLNTLEEHNQDLLGMIDSLTTIIECNQIEIEDLKGLFDD